MPDWESIVRERIAPLHLDGVAESSLVEEFSQHLEDRYRELCSGGTPEENAYRQTISELDDVNRIEAEMERNQRMPKTDPVRTGDASASNFIGETWRDVRYAGRIMRKNPAFVLFVVLTLALGIAANSTVFTVINTLILNPVPVHNPSELAVLGTVEVKSRSKSSMAVPTSYANLKDYRARNEVFISLAGYTSPAIVTLQLPDGSERMFGELVTGDYFSTLGIRAAKGRFFLPEEDQTPGSQAVAVMNYATWQGRFGGTNDIIGKTLRLNNLVFTVVGIAPPGFIGMNAIFGPDLWMPAAMAEQLWPNEMRAALSERSKSVFRGVGRLKPGIGRARAQADMAAIASSLAREYPEANEGRTATVEPITDVIYGDSGRSPILFAGAVLLAVVGLVLLIACSNVANLMLARSAARQQEIAVRLAMGASRRRLIRQLLTESLILGLMSGLVGLMIGYGGSQFLWSFLPSEVSSNLIRPKMDSTVVLFCVLISALMGLAFGTIPALRASRTSVAESLKEEARTSGRNRRRITLDRALLVGQSPFRSCRW